MSNHPSKALIRAARRAIENDFFLAGLLHEYQQTHHLSDESMAAFLECEIDDIPRLALCRRPSTRQDLFLRDVEYLARRFHLQADHLAAMIRQVDALRVLRQHPASTGRGNIQGLLQAARDREEQQPDETGETL